MLRKPATACLPAGRAVWPLLCRRQLGVVKYLAERYDLTDPRLAFLGASAGSLMVVLAACGVPAGQPPQID